MKFKLDGPEFKFRALEFFTTTHLVKTKYRAISIILYLLTITPPKNTPQERKCKKYPIFCKKYPTPQSIVIAIFATEHEANPTPCGLKPKTTKKEYIIKHFTNIFPEAKITKRETKPINYEK